MHGQDKGRSARAYHEAVGEDLDAGVAEGGGGELEVAEVAGEDLRGHGHEVVDHVHDHRRRRQPRQQAQLDGARRPRAPRRRRRRVRQDALQPAPGPAVRLVPAGHRRPIGGEAAARGPWVGRSRKPRRQGGGGGLDRWEGQAANLLSRRAPRGRLECFAPQPNGSYQ